jgi:peptidoglycan/xylan/chitin deacetylase (PgdA/CDA1 family)
MAKGTFCISLDFELLYGLSDLPNQEHQKQTVLGGKAAIPRMLALFEQYNIHASWCTVGMIMADDKQQLTAHFPQSKPAYQNTNLSNYCPEKVGENETEDPYHYAGNLLKQIQNTQGQAIGSHTFSHYYCLDEGQTKETFDEDLKAATALASQKGIRLQSLVLPRNQVNPDYIEVMAKNGILTFRDTEQSPLYQSNTSHGDSKVKRLLRLITTSFAKINMQMHKYFVKILVDYNESPRIFPRAFLFAMQF